jgi:hypothetical protein
MIRNQRSGSGKSGFLWVLFNPLPETTDAIPIVVEGWRVRKHGRRAENRLKK